MDKDDLRKFMCDGVAAKIGDEALWKASGGSRTNGRWTRTTSASSCATVWPPRSATRRCGITSGGSRTNGRWTRTTFAFMCGSVAAKIGDEALWDGLERLRTVVGVTMVCKITNDSLISRLSRSAAFTDSVCALCETLLREGMCKYVRRFMHMPYVGSADIIDGLTTRVRAAIAARGAAAYLKEFCGRTPSWHRNMALTLCAKGEDEAE